MKVVKPVMIRLSNQNTSACVIIRTSINELGRLERALEQTLHMNVGAILEESNGCEQKVWSVAVSRGSRVGYKGLVVTRILNP